MRKILNKKLTSTLLSLLYIVTVSVSAFGSYTELGLHNNNVTLVKMKYSSGLETSATSDYDDFNRRTWVQDGGNRIEYTYYANGLVMAVSVNGKITTYNYDVANRLTSASTPEGDVAYILSDAGKRVTQINPDGSKTEIETDFAGRTKNETTTKKDGGPISFYENSYDVNGNVTLKTTRYSKAPDDDKVLTYDDQDRLETITEGLKVTTFRYDAQGNRKAVEVKENNILVENKLYFYDDQQQLVLVKDTFDPTQNISFGYDENGNMVLRQQGANTETWEYSPRNQPLAYYLNGQLVETYLYNHEGMRVSKHNHIDNKTTNYFYDGHRIMEESDKNGNPIRSYRYGSDLVGYETGGLPQYTHTDEIGSITAVTSAGGEVLETRSYEPFGDSEVSQDFGKAANLALQKVRIIHENMILPLFFNQVPTLQPGDPPTTGILDVLSPDGIDVGEVWYPEIEMIINDDEDAMTNEVTIPITQVPLIMVSDLSPPFVELMVDQFYLTDNGTLTYTVSPGIDNNTTLTNAQISVTIPPQVDLTTFGSDLTNEIDDHVVTWTLDLNDIPETFQFWFDVTYADHENTILILQAKLLANGGSIERLSNRIYTAFRNSGLAFFAIPYIGDGGPATAYALPATVTNYYTDFECFILYFGEQSQNIRSFLGKEFDASTGLLYFDRRYYDFDLSRFTAEDPYLGVVSDPRTLNRYSYAFNNPLIYVDPNGEFVITVGGVLLYFAGQALFALAETGVEYYVHDEQYGDFNVFHTFGKNFGINVATGGIGGKGKLAARIGYYTLRQGIEIGAETAWEVNYYGLDLDETLTRNLIGSIAGEAIGQGVMKGARKGFNLYKGSRYSGVVGDLSQRGIQSGKRSLQQTGEYLSALSEKYRRSAAGRNAELLENAIAPERAIQRSRKYRPPEVLHSEHLVAHASATKFGTGGVTPGATLKINLLSDAGPGYFIKEKASMPPAARAWQGSDQAYRVHWKQKPGPRYRDWVDFDIWDRSKAQLVDRKWNVTEYPKSVKQARKQAEIAKQYGFSVRWEVPKNRVRAAERLIERAGVGEYIKVVSGN